MPYKSIIFDTSVTPKKTLTTFLSVPKFVPVITICVFTKPLVGLRLTSVGDPREVSRVKEAVEVAVLDPTLTVRGPVQAYLLAPLLLSVVSVASVTSASAAIVAPLNVTELRPSVLPACAC